jgi:hypothetical protein
MFAKYSELYFETRSGVICIRLDVLPRRKRKEMSARRGIVVPNLFVSSLQPLSCKRAPFIACQHRIDTSNYAFFSSSDFYQEK